jgi:hypothetical protein
LISGFAIVSRSGIRLGLAPKVEGDSMGKLKISAHLAASVAMGLTLGFAAPGIYAAGINGTITGRTVSAAGPDFTDTASTINVNFFSSCYFITNGIAAQDFGDMNFVFAGQGVASGISGISPSDFTISQYIPWVVDNNSTTNNISGPAVVKNKPLNSNRNVTDEDAGGCDIVISYTPEGADDPESVNFLQAYIDSVNGGAFTTGTIDNNDTADEPFYNQIFTAGTGTSLETGTSPLESDEDTPAWELDIPYSAEAGDPESDAPGYVPGNPIYSETVTFQTFISAEQEIDGEDYNVLYGGVQWGYTYSVPEPSTLLGLGTLIGVSCLRRRRRPPA